MCSPGKEERKYGHQEEPYCPVGTGRMLCPQTQLVPARGSLDVSYHSRSALFTFAWGTTCSHGDRTHRHLSS
ncbi:hypothetical protein QQF64_029771 [Cirrhinus molitorella]|uniref:Uncharacterized protein n=1 Tax=Cirrhinus molitorella TaxID=172907 RepID=A0ABR3N1F6_9TELE